MTDEKKGIAEAMKEEVTAYEEEREKFGGDHDDGTEESHVSLDPEDVEVD